MSQSTRRPREPGSTSVSQCERRRHLGLAEGCEQLVVGPGRAHRQHQAARRAGEQAELDGLGRGPDPGPVLGRHGHAQAMAGGEGVGDRVEGHGRVEALAGHKRSRLLVAVAVRQIEHLPGDELGAAVGRHVAEAHADQGARLVDGEPQGDLGRSQDLERGRERRRGEAQRATVLGTLVERPVAGRALGAPGAGVHAGELWAAANEAHLGSGRSAGVAGVYPRVPGPAPASPASPVAPPPPLPRPGCRRRASRRSARGAAKASSPRPPSARDARR